MEQYHLKVPIQMLVTFLWDLPIPSVTVKARAVVVVADPSGAI